MRIVQACPYFHPHVGGVESHVHDVARELVRRGHEVAVVTSSEPGAPRRETLDGVQVLRSPTLTTLLRSPVTPRMSQDLREVETDLYHAHSPPPLASYFAARAAEATRRPLVLTYHCDLEVPGPFGPLVVGLYRRTLEAYTMARVRGVVATTQTYAATSRSVWNRDAVIVPNAVDAERFHPRVTGDAVRARHAIPPDAFLVLFVGRLVRHKGVQHLLRAMRGVDARLLVVGSGEYGGVLRRMAAAPGLREKVVFAGRVDHQELPRYYAACDLFVLPSTSRLEAFGIAALEAMASGKPVVVADVPGVREVVEDGQEGLLAEPMNPEDLARQVRVLQEDAGARRAMGARARRKVEEAFTIRSVVDRLEALYQEVQSTTRRG